MLIRGHIAPVTRDYTTMLDCAFMQPVGLFERQTDRQAPYEAVGSSI